MSGDKTPNEIEEEKIRKIINGKMRNTRKRPHTIERQKDIYDMSSPNRGYCLIFSNHVFKKLGRLIGYETDKEYFKTVFEELHFKCEIFEKFTAEELRQRVTEYAKMSPSEGKYPTNALVVVILSHGCKRYLYGYNFDDNCPEGVKDKITLDELQEICSNKNCPSLINKPKMFFVQACRGKNADYGLNNATREESRSTIALPALRSGKVRKFEVNQIRSNLPSSFEDVWVSYATTPNYISYVREGTGSVFGVQLCKELKQWAWHKSLNDIMISVTSAISQKDILTKHGKYGKQVVQNVTTGWKGKLFFNPGYYKPKTAHQSSETPLTQDSSLVENQSEDRNVAVIIQENNTSGSSSSILGEIEPLHDNTHDNIKRKNDEGDFNRMENKVKENENEITPKKGNDEPRANVKRKNEGENVRHVKKRIKKETIHLNKITNYFSPKERNKEHDLKIWFSQFEFKKKQYEKE